MPGIERCRIKVCKVQRHVYERFNKWLRKIIYVIASEMKWSEAISKTLRLRHSASLHTPTEKQATQ